MRTLDDERVERPSTPLPERSQPPPQPQEARLLALQASAGNRAVAGLIGRQPKPATKPDSRLDALEKRVDVNEKRTAALAQDAKYRGLYGAKLSSYKQVILRITGGLESAQEGFKKAQQEQANFDALVTQLIIAGVGLTMAFGFEPMLKAGLGKLNWEAQRIKDAVELWENPVLQTIGSSANVIPLVKGGGGGADAPGGGNPMKFLTDNMQVLEKLNQGFEESFAKRASGIGGADEEKLQALNLKTWETTYEAGLKSLDATCKGIEEMKSDKEVAEVFERYIWAQWMKSNAKMVMVTGKPGERYERPADKPDPSNPPSPMENLQMSLGSYIEDRLNAVGVAGQANVKLTGHWYSSNEPDDWKLKLLSWAWGYNEGWALSKK